jgi:hypothetical protein
MEKDHFKEYRKEAELIAMMLMDIYEDIYKSRAGNRAERSRLSQ